MEFQIYRILEIPEIQKFWKYGNFGFLEIQKYMNLGF